MNTISALDKVKLVGEWLSRQSVIGFSYSHDIYKIVDQAAASRVFPNIIHFKKPSAS